MAFAVVIVSVRVLASKTAVAVGKLAATLDTDPDDEKDPDDEDEPANMRESS